MFAELVALTASFLTALSSVMATLGMRDSNPDTANLVLTSIQTIVLTGILILDLPPINFLAAIWFALAGILGSFLGRLLTMISYKRIGVSSASALIGTSPLVTSLLAVLLLGEPFLLAIIFGAILVLAGIISINLRQRSISMDYSMAYLPLGASLFYAFSNVIRKMGTNIQPQAVLGAQLSTLSGLIACTFYMSAKGGFNNLQVSKGNISWLAGSGLVNAFAWVAITFALTLGKVSVVSSIVYSYPLFSVLLSRILIKDEAINYYIVLGSFLIVLGVTVVSFFG